MSCSTVSHSATVRMMRPTLWLVRASSVPPVAISASENGPTVVPKCGFDRRGVRSNPPFWSHFAALLLRFTTLLATAARPFVKSGASPSNSPHFCCSFAQFRTLRPHFCCNFVQFRTVPPQSPCCCRLSNPTFRHTFATLLLQFCSDSLKVRCFWH